MSTISSIKSFDYGYPKTLTYVDTRTVSTTVFLPSTIVSEPELYYVKDSYGNAALNPITISSIYGNTSTITINRNFGAVVLVSKPNGWAALSTDARDDTPSDIPRLSTMLGGQTAQRLSSLSTIISYGLSSITGSPGIASLSTIVTYCLPPRGIPKDKPLHYCGHHLSNDPEALSSIQAIYSTIHSRTV